MTQQGRWMPKLQWERTKGEDKRAVFLWQYPVLSLSSTLDGDCSHRKGFIMCKWKKRSPSCKPLPMLSLSFLLYFCLRRDRHFHMDTISPISREHLCHFIRCREKERQTRTFLMPLGEGQSMKGIVGIEITAYNGEVWNHPQSDHLEECRQQCYSHINKDLNEARKKDLSGADIDGLSTSVPSWERCNVNRTAVKMLRTPCCTFCSSHCYTLRLETNSI